MVSSRHRSARPVSNRRVASQMHRPRIKASKLQDYRHINIQDRAATENELIEPNTEESVFVRRESLQEEIEEQLFHEATRTGSTEIDSSTSTSPRPLTFAEATMSTKRGGHGGRKESYRSDDDAPLVSPLTLESLGPFKYTFKKKKKHNKWSPFDLSVADSASEAGSNSEVGADVDSFSRAVSPNLHTSTSIISTSTSSASFPLPPSPRRSAFTSTSTFPLGSDLCISDLEQSHETPTQASFEFGIRRTWASEKGHRSLDRGPFDFNHIEALKQTPISSTFDLNDIGAPQQTIISSTFHSRARTAEGKEEKRLFEDAKLGINDISTTRHTPTKNLFEFTDHADEDKDKGKDKLVGEVGFVVQDTDATRQIPTRNIFEFAAPVPSLAYSILSEESPLERVELDSSSDEAEVVTSDTESTKGRTIAAMASIAEAFGGTKTSKLGEDLFDSVEWDPDLPSGSAPDSPEPLEPVIVTSQPLTYTTVGSLVDPNAMPQFTAPNRIQREGAGRRPLMTFMQTRPSISLRHQDTSFLHPRDPFPSLGIQESMHYAQQLSQSPVRLYQAQQSTSSHSSHSNMSRCHQVSLTDDEMGVLRRLGGPQMISGNVDVSSGIRNQPSKPLSNMVASEIKHLPGQCSPLEVFANNHDMILPEIALDEPIDDGLRRSATLSGLEKMQTIQRLAKFANPMQELARSRLSALSATNFFGRTVANPSGLSASPSSTSVSLTRKIAADNTGELDRGYQFPPPGSGATSLSQANPLFGAYGASNLQPPPPSSQFSGVPQPLTAGPPGQRHYLTSVASKMSPSFAGLRHLGSESKMFTGWPENFRSGNIDPVSQAYFSNDHHQVSIYPNPLIQDLTTETLVSSPSHHPREPVYEGETVGSKLVDTLPITAVSKYYPRGLPSGMTGQFTPLSNEIKMENGLEADLVADEKNIARRNEVDEWFYGGQREYGKTTTDHINDMAHREHIRRSATLGPIGSPPEKTIQKQPITVEEMNAMTTAEAAKPLVDALFHTLLAYADESYDSESRRHLSGFIKPADFLIDDSDKGNTSFFGEDWGAPPMRVGSNSQSAIQRTSTIRWG